MKSEPFMQPICSTEGALPAARRRRILLVEAHPIVRNRMASLINREPDLEVCGLAVDGESAHLQVQALKPDLVVLGTVVSRRGDLDVLVSVKSHFPRQRVLVVSANDNILFAPKVFRAGASGFVTKQESTATLLAGVRSVLNGEAFVSNALRRRTPISSGAPIARFDLALLLTAREMEVFKMLGAGKTGEDIALELGISLKTVHTHRTRIKWKLGLPSVADLARAAMDANGNPHGSGLAQPLS